MDKPSEILLEHSQYDLIEKLAAANYAPEDIAIYLQLDIDKFKLALEDKESEIYKHFYRGRLIVRAGIDIGLINASSNGGVTAIQVQMKRTEQLEFEKIKQEIFSP